MDAQTFIERKKQKLEAQARDKQERGLDNLEVELRRQVKEIYTEAELREYEERKQKREEEPPADAALEPITKPKRISRRRSSASNRAFRSGRAKARSGRTSGVRSGRNSTSSSRNSTRRRGQRGGSAVPIVIGVAAALVVLVGLAVLF